MHSFFPRHTVEWKLEEPRALRRFTFSLVEMALLTGVVLRVFRSFILTHGSNTWLWVASLVGAMVFLLLMATVHLANFPIQRWAWRAPLFVLVETGTEMAMSALLILAGREPYGTVRADWSDWPAMALGTFTTRGAAILVWALLLAGIVQIVRRIMVRGAVEEERPA